MPRFATAEWVAALADAAADAALPEAGDAEPLTIRHVVEGGPEGDVAWWVRVAGGRVDAGPGPGVGADVVLTADYDTAAAVARGDLLARQALLAGRLRVSGEPGRLTRSAAALAALDRALVGLRAETEYP